MMVAEFGTKGDFEGQNGVFGLLLVLLNKIL